MRQRLVIQKDERSYVTREGDGPDVEWGDRDCTDRDVTWTNIRFSHVDKLKNWDTEVLFTETDKKASNPKQTYYGGWTDDMFKADKYCHYMGIPWDYEGPAIYVVIANYSDGDTFGHDDGYEEIVAVCATGEEALLYMEKRKPILEPQYDTYFGHLDDLKVLGLLLMPDEYA